MPTSSGEGGEILRVASRRVDPMTMEEARLIYAQRMGYIRGEFAMDRAERFVPLEEDKKVESKYLTEEDLEY